MKGRTNEVFFSGVKQGHSITFSELKKYRSKFIDKNRSIPHDTVKNYTIPKWVVSQKKNVFFS